MTSPAPRVDIITVGDELVAGRVADTHSRYAAELLESAGYRVRRHISVGDEPGDLAQTLETLGLDADALVIAGGLGPTVDDRTRQEMARAFGVGLTFDADRWREIETYMREHRVEVSENNRRQAELPQGATVLPNPRGTAPGFRIDRTIDGRRQPCWVLPGVPIEFHAMMNLVLEQLVLDLPTPRTGSPCIFSFFSISESKLDAWLENEFGAAIGHYSLCLRDDFIEFRCASPPAGRDGGPDDTADVWAKRCEERWGARFLGCGARGLFARLVDESTAARASIATAESCTGGGLGERLTSWPGASAFYAGGWTVYDDAMKSALLGVPVEVLSRYGAVSQQVVDCLAANARERAGVDLAVSISGVAGPGGGTAEKPVGTVWMGLASRDGCWHREFRFRGDRERIRSHACNFAAFALLQCVRGLSPNAWLRV